jgi:hypothetical protein
MGTLAPTDTDVRVLGVQELTSSKLCPSPRCKNEIRGDEELCHRCRSEAAPPPKPSSLPALRDPLGLDLPADLDLDTWTGFIRRIAVVTSATRWWIGDLLVQGNFPDGQKYAIAEHELGLERSTLANYCYVARNVERERRRPELPFAHHTVVAPLEPAQQRHWLARAVEERWTSAQLRAELGAVGLQAPVPGHRLPAPRPPAPEPEQLVQSRLTMTWPASLADRVRAIARERGVSIASLVAEAVERYLAD